MAGRRFGIVVLAVVAAGALIALGLALGPSVRSIYSSPSADHPLDARATAPTTPISPSIPPAPTAPTSPTSPPTSNAMTPAALPFAETDAPVPSGLLESEKNTIQVFRTAGPSVVFVTNNALRREFFSTDVSVVPQGAGSGFLWDTHGHVVTNYHVIENGQTFSVTLPSGITREAKVIGVEPRKDIAVLHFDTEGLEIAALPIGRSDSLIVGQKVLAIGNPFGLDRTLTTGIISALGREFPTQGGFVIEDVIQTDASINPGNSGGPLIDSAGRLIGVNTAIYSPSGASAGIGFAIPVDTVARIVPQLIRFGQIRRAGLGVTIVSEHIVRTWGVSGVVIREVFSGSEAARAGLRSIGLDRRGNVVSADVVTAIDGQVISSFADLANELDNRKPGEEVVLTVVRGPKTLPIELTLMEIGN